MRKQRYTRINYTCKAVHLQKIKSFGRVQNTPLWRPPFLAKDFFTTLQARMVIFSIQIDDNLLYCGTENQASLAYIFLYLSEFLSFLTLNMQCFVADLTATLQGRLVILGVHIDNDSLSPGIAIQPYPAKFIMYFFRFSSSKPKAYLIV